MRSSEESGDFWSSAVSPGSGSPGCLDTLQDLASRRGFTVLRGQATELESDIPLARWRRRSVPLSTGRAVDPELHFSAATRWQLYGSITAGLDDLARLGAGCPGDRRCALGRPGLRWNSWSTSFGGRPERPCFWCWRYDRARLWTVCSKHSE